MYHTRYYDRCMYHHRIYLVPVACMYLVLIRYHTKHCLFGLKLTSINYTLHYTLHATVSHYMSCTVRYRRTITRYENIDTQLYTIALDHKPCTIHLITIFLVHTLVLTTKHRLFGFKLTLHVMSCHSHARVLMGYMRPRG